MLNIQFELIFQIIYFSIDPNKIDPKLQKEIYFLPELE